MSAREAAGLDFFSAGLQVCPADDAGLLRCPAGGAEEIWITAGQVPEIMSFVPLMPPPPVIAGAHETRAKRENFQAEPALTEKQFAEFKAEWEKERAASIREWKSWLAALKSEMEILGPAQENLAQAAKRHKSELETLNLLYGQVSRHLKDSRWRLSKHNQELEKEAGEFLRGFHDIFKSKTQEWEADLKKQLEDFSSHIRSQKEKTQKDADYERDTASGWMREEIGRFLEITKQSMHQELERNLDEIRMSCGGLLAGSGAEIKKCIENEKRELHKKMDEYAVKCAAEFDARFEKIAEQRTLEIIEKKINPVLENAKLQINVKVKEYIEMLRAEIASVESMIPPWLEKMKQRMEEKADMHLAAVYAEFAREIMQKKENFRKAVDNRLNDNKSGAGPSK